MDTVRIHSAKRMQHGALALLLGALAEFTLGAQEVESKPTPVVNTVEPSVGSTGEKMDQRHDRIYDFIQRQVVSVDHWFVKEGQTALPVKPFEMSIGMFGQLQLATDNHNLVTFPVEFDSRIELTNANRYLDLIITSIDPTNIPVEDRHNNSRATRLGLERTWRDDFHSTVGLKVGLHPQIYSHLDWKREIVLGHYRFYPYERAYWETGNGIGTITSFMADRWQNCWDFRTAASIKWSKKKLDTDHQLNNDEKGLEWETSIGLGYVLELLKVGDVGRAIAGNDMGRGISARMYLGAAPGHATFTRFEVFLKGEIWEKWIYYIVAPEIEWIRANNWRRDIKLKFGVEMLFWKGR